MTRRLRHRRVELALHALAAGEGLPLLLLHALRGSSDDWRREAIDWPGPVHALDFCGHGASARLGGGAYMPELLAGDADAALAAIGPAAVAGSGLGAWVALLVAGARPDLVPAALLLPGAGLAGGGPDVASVRAEDVPGVEASAAGGEDPLLLLLDRDVRPPEYAEPFARAARRVLVADDVAAPPPWWQAVALVAKTVRRADAFTRLAAAARSVPG
jgi:pimeloyl-ACP methyl ester carboxylesterase